VNRMRRIGFVGLFLLALSTALTAQQKPPTAVQKTDHAIPPGQRKFLAAGPFLFRPGAIQPTYMDAFDSRPVVESPDGKLAVTVTGPKQSWGAWITISPSAFPDGPIQVWPLQANADVLWNPNSDVFALTDNRYANDSFVLVFGTSFRMGNHGSGLGVPITDLTPTIWSAFKTRAQEFYATDAYQADIFYAKALLWIAGDQLLVGLDARTSLNNLPAGSTWRDMKIKEWYLGYVVDVSQKKVVRELSESQLLSQYGISVAK
jgi:hypothetical protein